MTRATHTTAFFLSLGMALAGCEPAPAATAAAAPSIAQSAAGLQTAVFAGGCFWSVEKMMEEVPGVVSAVSGFAGGDLASPTYDRVVRGGTGHLEAVQVTFDPARITYRQLVDRFWRSIDPTDAGGQFCDRGASYGTAVFATDAQRPAADASREAAVAVIGERFRTPVRAAARFWPAEAEHQDFYRTHPTRYAGYSRFCGREARLRQVWSS